MSKGVRRFPPSTIITAGSPAWFFNSKILTPHKDTIIALHWPFARHSAPLINFFFPRICCEIYFCFSVNKDMWNFPWKHEKTGLSAMLQNLERGTEIAEWFTPQTRYAGSLWKWGGSQLGERTKYTRQISWQIVSNVMLLMFHCYMEYRDGNDKTVQTDTSGSSCVFKPFPASIYLTNKKNK